MLRTGQDRQHSTDPTKTRLDPAQRTPERQDGQRLGVANLFFFFSLPASYANPSAIVAHLADPLNPAQPGREFGAMMRERMRTWPMGDVISAVQ